MQLFYINEITVSKGCHIAKKCFFWQKKDFRRSLDKNNMVPGAGIEPARP
jgi:hypothetical protein